MNPIAYVLVTILASSGPAGHTDSAPSTQVYATQADCAAALQAAQGNAMRMCLPQLGTTPATATAP